MSKLFVLWFMIFCHVVDDFYLQGFLASLKQKKWWEKNAPAPLYKHDYIIALAIHSFSWAFMIMLPIAMFYHFDISGVFLWFLAGNIVAHASVDHTKANALKINLIQDQLFHIAQICVTYCALM